MKRLRVLILMPGELPYVALWCPDESDPFRAKACEVKIHGPDLIQMISTLCQENQCSLATLTHIGVMAVPASYTQLRLFVATANTLAWTLNLPIFSFTPSTKLPDDLPECLTKAKLNVVIDPVYPHLL